MPIRYIHNDPASVPMLETEVVPRPARTGQLARFGLPAIAPEQVYPTGTPEFTDWQCREAALRTLETWELVASPLRFWHNQSRTIRLIPRGTTALAATYDRDSIGFGQWPEAGVTFFVAASTDAVSHEVGHAILDACRPELWDSLFTEVAAFHEGFSDCLSLLVALLDDRVTAAMLAAAPAAEDALRADNASAQVAESVAAKIESEHGANHPGSIPRRLRNSLQWAIPTTLPPNPTPTNLSREPHSFGRVFAGCFYDCIDHLYRDRGLHDAIGLRDAALTAGALLVAAVETAPEEIRFFRSVGRAMVIADSGLNGGDNHLAIRDAFAAHNIALGSTMLLAPTMALEGPEPPLTGSGTRRLNSRTRRDLARRVGAPLGLRVSARSASIGPSPVLRTSLRHRMRLRIPGSRPGAVVGRIHEELLIGSERRHSVVLGELPNRHAAEDEAVSFVESLVDAGGLDPSHSTREHTHSLRKRGNERVLQRVRFRCMPARRP